MGRHLSFTPSQDGELRASTWIEFRVEKEYLAFALTRCIGHCDTHDEAMDKMYTITKSDIEKELRKELWSTGSFIIDPDPWEEEIFEDCLMRVRELYDI